MKDLVTELDGRLTSVANQFKSKGKLKQKNDIDKTVASDQAVVAVTEIDAEQVMKIKAYGKKHGIDLSDEDIQDLMSRLTPAPEASGNVMHAAPIEREKPKSILDWATDKLQEKYDAQILPHIKPDGINQSASHHSWISKIPWAGVVSWGGKELLHQLLKKDDSDDQEAATAVSTKKVTPTLEGEYNNGNGDGSPGAQSKPSTATDGGDGTAQAQSTLAKASDIFSTGQEIDLGVFSSTASLNMTVLADQHTTAAADSSVLTMGDAGDAVDLPSLVYTVI